MAILFALVGGYLVSLCFIPLNNMVDFSGLTFNSVTDFVNVPKPVFFFLEFSASNVNIGAIVSVVVIFIVALVETMSGVENLSASAFDRPATTKEVTGGIATASLVSTIGAFFGSMPMTPYNQNISITAQSRVKNHNAMFIGAAIMILASFFPPISKVLQTIPTSVLGGALLCLFASIAVSGMKIIASIGFSPKNILVLSLALGLGYGVTLMDDFLKISSEDTWVNYLRLVMANPVAMMFIFAMIFSWAIPESVNKEEAN